MITFSLLCGFNFSLIALRSIVIQNVFKRKRVNKVKQIPVISNIRATEQNTKMSTFR